MKVKELIEMLEDCEEDAEVFIMSQPNWPFEYAVAGVTVREEFVDYDDEEEDEPLQVNGCGTARDTRLSRNDVFILEGEQLRYGSRGAWEAPTR